MEMMDMAADDTREELRRKLRSNFDGRIVRKDLTKKIKEGANVPVYVLEFLLGQYCSSDDETIIEQGVQNVKRILADNFVRPDEAQKILSQLRKNGSHTIIDMVTVHLDIKKDCFFAEFSNLGLTNVPITDDYPEKYDRLLCGGIWCIVQLEYESEGDSSFGITDIDGQPISSKQKKQKDISPISIHKLTPIQMPHIDIEEVREGRKAFTQEEWMDVMLRSCGYEPEQLNNREKWLLLARMLPLVENNFNLCELGPRSTGKSHIYKEISPNSILVSGGQTTVANLFYNMGRKTVGLVGLWDCVAFDEVAGIKFKDKDGIQIMKDYMASGSFARGKEEKAASASMVFVGNINQSVDVLLKTSSLFDPFPPEMGTDTAFLDRLHCYIPGWEIPKFRPEHFTNDYGFITDYLAEFIRELRKEQYADSPMDNEQVGEEVYISMINKAEKYCWFMTPYLIITDEMTHALCLAAKRGVDVRIITPGIPDKKFIYNVTRSFYHGLVKHGVRVYEWTPGFCHAKMSVADDCMATCGTINLDYRSLYHHFENGCFMADCQAVVEIKNDLIRTMGECRDVTDQYQTGRSAYLRLGQLFMRLFAGLL